MGGLASRLQSVIEYVGFADGDVKGRKLQQLQDSASSLVESGRLPASASVMPERFWTQEIFFYQKVPRQVC
jgi:hypothetical protein